MKNNLGRFYILDIIYKILTMRNVADYSIVQSLGTCLIKGVVEEVLLEIFSLVHRIYD